MKSHTSAVQLKIVSGKQKGKILKHSEIVAHKQKGVKGRDGGGGVWVVSRQLQAFINEKKIHWTSCYCLNCLNPLTVQMVSDHNT